MSKFQPVITTAEKLNNNKVEIINGQFIVVTDEPAIYADYQNERIKISNTSSGEGGVQYKPGTGIQFITNSDGTITINNTGTNVNIEIIDDYWYIDGENTGVKAAGEDGITPTIYIDEETKMWVINDVSTGVVAQADSITQSEYQAMIDLLDSINSKIETALNEGV